MAAKRTATKKASPAAKAAKIKPAVKAAKIKPAAKAAKTKPSAKAAKTKPARPAAKTKPTARKAAKTKPARKAARPLPPTAHQTTGPFFPAQFFKPGDNDLAGLTDGDRPRAQGAPCVLFGTVRDAEDRPAVNAILEIWQANAAGRFNHPLDTSAAALDENFSGWGRTWTDREGRYRFITVKPGGYRAGARSNRWFAPRIGLTVLGSGLMRPLVTCVYFPDEPLNDEDPQLEAIRDPRTRRQFIAAAGEDPGAPPGVPCLRFDIVLGGKHATPFLED